MKLLTEYCHQVRRYGPSKGHRIIELEEGDDIETIKKEHSNVDKKWYEMRYYEPRRVKEFTTKYGTVYTGDLLVFDTYQEYLD